LIDKPRDKAAQDMNDDREAFMAEFWAGAAVGAGDRALVVSTTPLYTAGGTTQTTLVAFLRFSYTCCVDPTERDYYDLRGEIPYLLARCDEQDAAFETDNRPLVTWDGGTDAFGGALARGAPNPNFGEGMRVPRQLVNICAEVHRHNDIRDRMVPGGEPLELSKTMIVVQDGVSAIGGPFVERKPSKIIIIYQSKLQYVYSCTRVL
jgi:hypothetical protein